MTDQASRSSLRERVDQIPHVTEPTAAMRRMVEGFQEDLKGRYLQLFETGQGPNQIGLFLVRETPDTLLLFGPENPSYDIVKHRDGVFAMAMPLNIVRTASAFLGRAPFMTDLGEIPAIPNGNDIRIVVYDGEALFAGYFSRDFKLDFMVVTEAEKVKGSLAYELHREIIGQHKEKILDVSRKSVELSGQPVEEIVIVLSLKRRESDVELLDARDAEAYAAMGGAVIVVNVTASVRDKTREAFEKSAHPTEELIRELSEPATQGHVRLITRGFGLTSVMHLKVD